MDIHKPKPFHSLREFLSELITIVTGIVIALWLEALVEHERTQNLVEFSRADFREEIGSNRDSLQKELTESARLQGELEKMIAYERARLAHQNPTMPEKNFVRGFVHLRSAAWSGAISTQVMAHFPHAEEQAISKAYTEQEAFTAIEQSAELSWFNLAGSASAQDGMTDPEIRAALQQFMVSYSYLISLQAVERSLIGTFEQTLKSIQA